MMKKYLILIIFGICTSTLFLSCGEIGAGVNDGSNEESSDSSVYPPDSNEDGPAKPGSGDIAIFFRLYMGENNTYMHEQGIMLESDTYGIFRYLPSQKEIYLIDKYTDQSWAETHKLPYTQDGKLYIIDGSSNRYDSSGWSFPNYNPETCEFSNHGRSFYDAVCEFVVVEDSVYYYETRRTELLSGYVGGELKICNGPTKTTLIEYTEANNHYTISKGLFAVNENFYSISKGVSEELGPMFEVYRRNKSTGLIDEVILSYTITDDSEYDDWHFDMSKHAVFWIRRKISNGTIELWKNFWGADSPVKVSDIDNSGSNFSDLDVSDDIVLIELLGGENKGKFLIYDDTAESSTLFNFEVTLGDTQIYKYP